MKIFKPLAAVAAVFAISAILAIVTGCAGAGNKPVIEPTPVLTELGQWSGSAHVNSGTTDPGKDIVYSNLTVDNRKVVIDGVWQGENLAGSYACGTEVGLVYGYIVRTTSDNTVRYRLEHWQLLGATETDRGGPPTITGEAKMNLEPDERTGLHTLTAEAVGFGYGITTAKIDLSKSDKG